MATRNAELKLEKLQERHFGVTESLAAVLYESASLCLDRHFSSTEEFVVTADIAHVAPRSQAYTVEWTAPMVRQRDAWQAGEATEFGACCLALAAAEEHLQRVCRARAELGSGAD